MGFRKRRAPKQYNWEELQFDVTILDKHWSEQGGDQKKYVVLHHMAIVSHDTREPDALNAMWNVWQTRPASAHYGVDDVFVRQYVWDSDYAWATGNTEGNRKGISIEHANLSSKGWVVRRLTWKTGAKLVAAIHLNKGWGRPTPRTIKKHRDFKATACPGPYMVKIYPKYVKEAQKQYDKMVKAKNKPKKKTRGKNIDHALWTLWKAWKANRGSRRKQIEKARQELKKIKQY